MFYLLKIAKTNLSNKSDVITSQKYLGEIMNFTMSNNFLYSFAFCFEIFSSDAINKSIFSLGILIQLNSNLEF